MVERVVWDHKVGGSNPLSPTRCYWYAPVAQGIEHLPSKQVAGGSNPSRRVEMVGVAQLVRVPVCGTGCRGFESLHPPLRAYSSAG